jgi:hypothetical protein
MRRMMDALGFAASVEAIDESVSTNVVVDLDERRDRVRRAR